MANKKFKVVALSVGGIGKVFSAGDTVTDDNFEVNIYQLVRQGFVEEAKAASVGDTVKEIAEIEDLEDLEELFGSDERPGVVKAFEKKKTELEADIASDVDDILDEDSDE